MARKIIGIPMANQGENSVGMTKPYLEYLSQYGDIILLGPSTFIPELDLLVLPGGKDVANGNPNQFSYYNSDNERFLEFFDANTLPKYIDNVTPIYGICRGMQTIMRHFGIPLQQNIWWDHGYSKDENDTKVNTLIFAKYAEWQKHSATIGSWHHQGVTLDTFKQQEEFELIAFTHHKAGETYSIVEFAEHKELPIIVEQSHPERNTNLFERFLFQKLLNEL